MMCPQLLVLTTLVTTASWIKAAEICVDCNLLAIKEASDVPRPASCSTDCFLQEQSKPEIFTPWSQLGPVLQFDDAGIYYEPAEMLPVDQVAFITQPFYILNPAYQDDRRVSRSSTKLDEDTESTLSFNKHVPKRRHNKPNKHPKKYEILHKESERQYEKLPLYLDVDIQELRTESGITSAVDTNFENIKLAEQYLSICLDLHVLEFYRKNDSTFKNLKDVWDYPKFHYYESLSDLDLEKEIINKCNHSINIVMKSLNEIKDTWPKNNVLTFSTSRAIPINTRSGDISNQTFYIHSDHTISNTSVEKMFTPIPTFTEQTSSAINIFDSTATKSTVNTHNIDNDNIFRRINPYNGNQFQLVDQIDFDLTNASIDGSTSQAMNINSTGVVQQPQVQGTSHLPNFYIEDQLQLNSSHDPGHKNIEGNSDSSSYANTSYTNSKIYFIPMIQTTLNIPPKDVQTPHNTTEYVVTEPETIPDTGNSVVFFTTSYAENDNTYSKVNSQVSDIVTKEYPNDTAISAVEDSLLNNNSVFVENDTPAVTVTSDTSTPMTTANTVETDDKIMNSENLLLGEHLTGNLYFLYKNNSVPARFIQDPDGKINVGLDGFSVCDSAKDSTVKFILLNVICNCVKFSNCTNET